MPTPSRRELLIALNASAEISRPAVYRLAQELDLWLGADSPPERLAAAAGVPRRQLQRALAVAGTAAATDIAARETAEAERLGGRIVTLEDGDYPASLRQLSPPPPAVYVRGEMPPGPAVAIVGSRRPDAYGEEAAGLFARNLAAAGITVVSGFARGIDAVAHRGALEAPDGRTVAVLGCGLGMDYPRGHGRLAGEIAARGALLTEFSCAALPKAWHFPLRNRSIAALTAGTLVVQAALRSGSLITAHHALDLGREVWAVPGRIFDEGSLGANALIREGAQLVQHPADLLEVLLPRGTSQIPLPLSMSTTAAPEPPSGFAGQVFSQVPPGGSRIAEEIAVRLDAPIDQVLAALLELELEGRVKRLPGSAYGR
ncbi:MAG TPA: DNA-processing protein DprA [Thermoanaerobaculia bacterium]|jgi:DNA processing protein|nr:DNA-processing protein DprA [Thermoanaerobaculia bacterium]